MNRVLVASVALLAVGIPACAKPKPPCSVYFSVVQVGPSLPNGKAQWLNLRQKSWFDQYGGRGKFAGICYDPEKANYLIRWTKEQFKQSNGKLVVWIPPAQSDTSASGRLFRIGKNLTLAPLETFSEDTHSRDGQSPDVSASVALLKDGLEAIARAEKARAKSPDTPSTKRVSF